LQTPCQLRAKLLDFSPKLVARDLSADGQMARLSRSHFIEALAGLRSRSCIIDGEAVVCDERGIAAFAYPIPPK
jgi:hypothetical protein